MKKGYLLLTFGGYYVEEAINLVRMIRKTGDTLPVSVVCTEEDVPELEQSSLFDKIIIHSFTHPLYQTCTTSFEKFCLVPRLLFDTFLQYDETIIVDTDMLCQTNPCGVWDEVKSLDQCVVMTGQNISPDWHFGYNHEVSEKLGKNVPESHGGFFYINRLHKDLKNFFNLAINVYHNYDNYGLKRMFRGGRVDEPIFAIVNAHMDYKVLEFGESPIITFNYDMGVELPSKFQSFGKFKDRTNWKELRDIPPFVHMFKPHRGEYFKLVDKILNQ